MEKIDFLDSRVAFESKSDKELKSMEFLFRMMSKPRLTKITSKIGLQAVRWNLPFVHKLVERTVFKQFCGGKTLEESVKVIKELESYGVSTILDYGAEGRESESEFDHTVKQTMASLEFASNYKAVPIVSTKITGLARTQLLIDYQKKKGQLNAEESEEFQRVIDRVDSICKKAKETDVCVMIDAEESPFQDTIDRICEMMMERYNTENVVVYHTFQLYRKDKLDYLKRLYDDCVKKDYYLGAKLVRGAYMEKERRWAKQGGYPSPIHETKDDTDRDYNAGIMFCVERYERIALCNASHNRRSAQAMVDKINELGLPTNHPRLNFCQLYGMSDFITFNLANEGYNLTKYVPYGPIDEVIPYLIRRAQENTAVSGEMNREYGMIVKEMKRRKLW